MQKNSRAQRSKDILQSMVAAGSITSDGREWLTTALDPFHDYNHQIAGYPDADVSQTVVSCYQYEDTVSAPAGVAGNWDCHIFNTPASYPTTAHLVSETALWSYMQEPALAAPALLGPIVAFSTASGAALMPDLPSAANTHIQVMPPVNTEDISSGCSRVVAMGFEVHNTTAEIYKQGSVTTYRLPQNGGLNSEIYLNSAGTTSENLLTKRFRMPPKTIGNANLLKGTRTWEAKDGVYATCLQSTVNNPLKQMASVGLVFSADSDPGATQNVIITNPHIVVGGNAAHGFANKASNHNCYDTTGAIFTGLSSQTTLTIKLRVYVERAPTWNDPAIAVLASPSAGYDIRALEIYAAAINMLPPAVMVGENAKGDWWRAIVSVIKAVAGPVGLALNTVVPGAGLVGTTIGNMAGQIDTKRPVSSQAVSQELARRRLKTRGKPNKEK